MKLFIKIKTIMFIVDLTPKQHKTKFTLYRYRLVNIYVGEYKSICQFDYLGIYFIFNHYYLQINF